MSARRCGITLLDAGRGLQAGKLLEPEPVLHTDFTSQDTLRRTSEMLLPSILTSSAEASDTVRWSSSSCSGGFSDTRTTEMQTQTEQGILDDDQPVLDLALKKDPSLVLGADVLKVSDRVLGQGGSGEVRGGVYNDCTEVVIKLPRSTHANPLPKAERSLANELALLTKLRHENVVLFYGCAVTNGMSGLVFHFVAGGDYRQFVKHRHSSGALERECQENIRQDNLQRPLTEQRLLLDVAKGMVYLHAQCPPIIHLDLKPSNILLESETPRRAVISDFGLATLLFSCGATRQAGTRGYMAPEVVRGKSYGTPADVFSFGSVCIFSLTGIDLKNPVTPDACDDLLLHSREQACFSAVLKVAARCLTSEPKKRPSFRGVCQDLREKRVEATDTADAEATHEGQAWKNPRQQDEAKSKSSVAHKFVASITGAVLSKAPLIAL
eukprot:TRINITY_DN101325_c0_g1_i1.p1 TRINITY_DN101325_c0_g1~~TRINITY_DN101325_c0_g1_i1.p1  ORF type:complete len:439 (-),score=49.18 TRINITY_DN101325_c0_g1_i1:230-1546(-)